MSDQSCGDMPAPSPIGWLMSGPEPTDTIGVLVLLVLAVQVLINLRWLGQSEEAPQSAATAQAQESRVR